MSADIGRAADKLNTLANGALKNRPTDILDLALAAKQLLAHLRLTGVINEMRPCD